MYGAPYIALGTTIASGNTHPQAATGHEALGVLNLRVRRERGTKKSVHTGDLSTRAIPRHHEDKVVLQEAVWCQVPQGHLWSNGGISRI